MHTHTVAAPVASDPLGFTARRRRAQRVTVGLGLGLLIAMVGGICLGAAPISPQQILGVLGEKLFGLPADGITAATSAIVWDVRLPRVLLGLFVGAGLAVCGVALQAMVRNMLADPYLLGINSGASTGAAAAILFGFGAGLGEHALQASAFLGALAASLLVYALARSGGRVTSVRLILSGVTIGYVLYAVTSFLIFASGSAEGSRSVMFWLLGSLSLAEWGTPLIVVAIITVCTVSLLALSATRLDALTLGDGTALALGVQPTRTRSWLLALVALCIGVLVAAAGSISFVGLILTIIT